MMKGHMNIALNIGITEAQLEELLNVIEINIGRSEAEAGRKLLEEISNQ
jgi:alkylhydroperoxidase/carboxymuconolactone decarboxylase family protein YurZ